jgi:ParB family chromosome partitioning protein
MRKALGRGLNALFPDSPTAPAASTSAAPAAAPAIFLSPKGLGSRPIRVDQIRPSAAQPRQAIDEDELQGLADSIRQHGIIQPLLVRASSGGFELIAGERRWRAAKLAGLEMVPAIVREATDAESFEIALVENVQRKDLTPLEEAEAYLRLIEDHGLTQGEVASRVGKKRATVANMVRLLGLPDEVKVHVASGLLSMGHARAILAAPTAAKQIALATEILNSGMTVRDAEHATGRPAGGSRRTNGCTNAGLEARAVEEELQGLLGTRVRLVSRGEGGSIDIRYHSRAELNRLIDCLRGCRPLESNTL